MTNKLFKTTNEVLPAVTLLSSEYELLAKIEIPFSLLEIVNEPIYDPSSIFMDDKITWSEPEKDSTISWDSNAISPAAADKLAVPTAWPNTNEDMSKYPSSVVNNDVSISGWFAVCVMLISISEIVLHSLLLNVISISGFNSIHGCASELPPTQLPQSSIYDSPFNSPLQSNTPKSKLKLWMSAGKSISAFNVLEIVNEETSGVVKMPLKVTSWLLPAVVVLPSAGADDNIWTPPATFWMVNEPKISLLESSTTCKLACEDDKILST